MDVRAAALSDGSSEVTGSSRGDDWRWPCYLEERQALEWMADRLRRGGIFE
jgi:hypothetical protein